MPTTSPSLRNALGQERELLAARQQQNVLLGFLAGFMAAVIAAALWAGLAIGTNIWFGWLAMPLGALTGSAIRFFGRGFELFFSFVAVGCTLLGTAIAAALIGAYKLTPLDEPGLRSVTNALQHHTAPQLVTAGFTGPDIAMLVVGAVLSWRLARGAWPLSDAPRGVAKIW